MLCHFQSRPARQRSRAQTQSWPAWTPPATLAPLLSRLIGRNVSVVAGSRLATGKLVRSNPITLVSADGTVTVLTRPASSVAF